MRRKKNKGTSCYQDFLYWRMATTSGTAPTQVSTYKINISGVQVLTSIKFSVIYKWQKVWQILFIFYRLVTKSQWTPLGYWKYTYAIDLGFLVKIWLHVHPRVLATATILNEIPNIFVGPYLWPDNYVLYHWSKSPTPVDRVLMLILKNQILKTTSWSNISVLIYHITVTSSKIKKAHSPSNIM